MNIYLLQQEEVSGWDTYDSAVVVARNEQEARLVRPDMQKWNDESFSLSWASKPENVTVTFLGKLDKNYPIPDDMVILGSFNAG